MDDYDNDCNAGIRVGDWLNENNVVDGIVNGYPIVKYVPGPYSGTLGITYRVRLGSTMGQSLYADRPNVQTQDEAIKIALGLPSPEGNLKPGASVPLGK